MTLGLDAAMNLLEDDDALWAGVLTGNGRAFSAGSDLADPDRNSTERGGPYGLIRRARRKPLIAAVDGLAFGGGFEMVLACDLVVASRRARFALPEVKRGLLALYGGVFRGARALPLNLAREMVLTGEPIDAERAHALGLVNRLCDDGAALDDGAGAGCSHLRQQPGGGARKPGRHQPGHRRRRRAGLAAQHRGGRPGARLGRQPRRHRRLPGKARTALARPLRADT